MRYGTLWCWLFGHKCVFKYRRYNAYGDTSFTGYTPLGFCKRCGCPRAVPQIARKCQVDKHTELC